MLPMMMTSDRPREESDRLTYDVDWTPVGKGGANFCDQRLRALGPGRVVRRATFGALVFGMVFAVVGACAAVFGVAIGAGWGQGEGSRAEIVLILLVFALAFGGAGILVLRAMTRPMEFDKAAGVFRAPGANDVELSRIRALQVLAKRVSSRNSSYTSYELNLVLDDGKRTTVLNHGARAALLEDAELLSQTLGLSVLQRALAPVESPTAVIVSLLTMIPMALVGIGIAVFAGAQMRASWRIVHDYEPATCKVTGYDSSASRDKHGHVDGYFGIVRIAFDLDGHPYDDSETLGTRLSSSAAAVQAATHAYPLGSSVSCFYDPQAPTEMTLTKTDSQWIPLAAFALIWNLIVGLTIFRSVRTLVGRVGGGMPQRAAT